MKIYLQNLKPEASTAFQSLKSHLWLFKAQGYKDISPELEA
jgi:hypothetical protein